MRVFLTFCVLGYFKTLKKEPLEKVSVFLVIDAKFSQFPCFCDPLFSSLFKTKIDKFFNFRKMIEILAVGHLTDLAVGHLTDK